MGWKAIRDHFRIGHIVHVSDGRVCIGSPYVHDLIVIHDDGSLSGYSLDTSGGLPSNEDLARYVREMRADPELVRRLLVQEDQFDKSITVWTYDDEQAKAVQKFCEEPNWPNVTHDGQLMMDNTFYETAIEAARYGLRNARAGLRMLSRSLDRAAKDQQELCDLMAETEIEVATLLSDWPQLADES